MPSYARWPPASPVRPGITPVAVRGDAPVAVGRDERGGFPPARAPGVRRPHGQTDMRILFLPASLARLVPGHPAVFAVSDLARAALLTLTGPRNYDGAA